MGRKLNLVDILHAIFGYFYVDGKYDTRYASNSRLIVNEDDSGALVHWWKCQQSFSIFA